MASQATVLKPSDNVESHVRHLSAVLLSEHNHVHHAMQNITVRLDEDLITTLEDEAAEHGRSRSEHIRTIVATRHEHDTEHSEYEGRIADLKAENEQLRDQLAATNQRIDTTNELVEHVEEQRSIAAREQSITERRANAGVLTRTKWWLLGMETGSESDE